MIRTYVPKATPVLACRFQNTPPGVICIKQLLGTRFVGIRTGAVGDWVVWTDDSGSVKTTWAGDYVVIGEDGMRSMSPTLFESTYSLAQE